MNPREIARSIFDAMQRALRPDAVIARALVYRDNKLQIGEHGFDLAQYSRILIIAVGKAAPPMAEGVLRVFAEIPLPSSDLRGVVIGPSLPFLADSRFEYFQGGHPTPNAKSLAAADAVIELLESCDEHCLLLVLLSGGASSMMEKPLDPEMTANDIASFHRSLVHSGLAIGEMNVLRKHFSAVKGGRLAVAARGATVCTLIVSDVPADAIHIVGSGPTLPDPSTVAQCRDLTETHREALRLDAKLLAYFASRHFEETPKNDHSAFRNNVCVELLSSVDQCRAAASAAAEFGLETIVDTTCDEWDYSSAASYLIDRLTHFGDRTRNRCIVSAGELSVSLGDRHGVGGRNQHFVLECCRLAAERGVDVTVLSAGSDGIDGNSPAAGAIGDQRTPMRAAALGFPVERALAAFDSYTLLHALGDTIEIGPTGNNVRDLRLLITPAQKK